MKGLTLHIQGSLNTSKHPPHQKSSHSQEKSMPMTPSKKGPSTSHGNISGYLGSESSDTSRSWVVGAQLCHHHWASASFLAGNSTLGLAASQGEEGSFEGEQIRG